MLKKQEKSLERPQEGIFYLACEESRTGHDGAARRPDPGRSAYLARQVFRRPRPHFHRRPDGERQASVCTSCPATDVPFEDLEPQGCVAWREHTMAGSRFYVNSVLVSL